MNPPIPPPAVPENPSGAGEIPPVAGLFGAGLCDTGAAYRKKPRESAAAVAFGGCTDVLLGLQALASLTSLFSRRFPSPAPRFTEQ